MPKYFVYLNISYLDHIKDPEGETIRRELLERAGLGGVEVRAGKCLRLALEAKSPEDAASSALELARSLRLGNPHVHSIAVLKVEECRR